MLIIFGYINLEIDLSLSKVIANLITVFNKAMRNMNSNAEAWFFYWNKWVSRLAYFLASRCSNSGIRRERDQKTKDSKNQLKMLKADVREAR